MEIYLAYETIDNVESYSIFRLIGAFKTKEEAILAVEKAIQQYTESNEFIEITTIGDKIYWVERGMDTVTLGYIEKTKLEE